MDPSDLIHVTPLRPRRPHEDDNHSNDNNENHNNNSRHDGGTSNGQPADHGHSRHEPALHGIGDPLSSHAAMPSDELRSRGLAVSPPPPARREDWSYIWGTDIAVELFRHEFRQYLESYQLGTETHTGDDASSPAYATLMRTSATQRDGFNSNSMTTSASSSGGAYYLKEMLIMHLQSRTTLELNMTWMAQAVPHLYRHVVQHPTECLQMITTVAEELYREVLLSRHGIVVPDDVILTVAPKQLDTLVTIKALSPSHVEQLLGIKGMVTRVSKIIPEIRVACFRCWNCQYTERSVSGDKGRIFEPTRCTHCGKTYSFRLQHNLSL